MREKPSDIVRTGYGVVQEDLTCSYVSSSFDSKIIIKIHGRGYMRRTLQSVAPGTDISGEQDLLAASVTQ